MLFISHLILICIYVFACIVCIGRVTIKQGFFAVITFDNIECIIMLDLNT